jgi:hypothetical protein
MAGDDRQLRQRELALDLVEVGVAEAARADPETDFAGAGDRRRQVDGLEGIALHRTGGPEEHRAHRH